MKSKKIKTIAGALLIAMTGAIFTGCGSSGAEDDTNSNGSTTISISGSTSVGPLMEKVAEVYEEKNPNVVLEIQQPGSGTGIKNAIDGIAEIGMSSRDLASDEAGKVNGTEIAYDGVAVLVNPKNTAENLTIEQIKKIYTGEITNWSEVGGKDASIVVISREEGSGTRSAFQEIVGYESEEMLKDAMISDGSGAVQTAVAGNENAIGYASFEYINSSVKALNVEGVEPTAENVKNSTYKISRPFLLVTKEDTLTEEGQKLIDFILSDEGQKIVEENKLITIK